MGKGKAGCSWEEALRGQKASAGPEGWRESGSGQRREGKEAEGCWVEGGGVTSTEGDWVLVPGPGDSHLPSAVSRARESSLLEKNIMFKGKSKCHRCPDSMSPGMLLVTFSETLSRAGELTPSWCSEVPVEVPLLGVQGHLALHWPLWPGKGSVLVGLLFVPSGGAAERAFRGYVLVSHDA